MTNWLPDISEGPGPIYVRIADRIENAIDTGTLPVGDKLPPQRDLAYDLGVTIGTISRAYALARERGLVSGEVGRGTYVLANNVEGPAEVINLRDVPAGTRVSPQTAGALRFDTTAPNIGQADIIERHICEIMRENRDEYIGYIQSIPDSWLEAGRMWLSTRSWQPEKENIVSTLGAHAALMSAIVAVTSPGDRIVMEELTYASVARSTAVYGRRVVTVESDSDGFDPAAFEAVCAQQHPRAAFLVPVNQNPTGITMPESRRRAIAEVAKRYNVWLIEDAVYDTLALNPLPRIAEFAPDRTFVVNCLSKSVGAGIRGGWIACPPHMAGRVLNAHKLITGGKPYLTSELAARLVLSGDAESIRQKSRNVVAGRVNKVRQAFDGFEFTASDYCPFIWLELPDPWKSSEFRKAAAEDGVLVDDEDEYKPLRTNRMFHRVRIGFSMPRNEIEMDTGLSVIRALLSSTAITPDSYS
jgi:DNA-binding transcriptional MocR family regulator